MTLESGKVVDFHEVKQASWQDKEFLRRKMFDDAEITLMVRPYQTFSCLRERMTERLGRAGFGVVLVPPAVLLLGRHPNHHSKMLGIQTPGSLFSPQKRENIHPS